MLGEPEVRVLVESPDPLGLTNLLTGVTIGVTTAILLGLGEWLRRWLRRREQIKFVREFFVEKFKKIRDEEPLPPLPSGESAPPIDAVRWVFYQTILRDLEVALSYRLTELDYEKIHELQTILAGQKDMIRNLFGTDRFPGGLDYYRQRYDNFRALEWLNLPPDLIPAPEPP